MITHHHIDHTGGVLELKAATGAYVMGPSKKIDGVDRSVGEGEQINLESIRSSFNIFEIPGHTHDHIAYYNEQWLFCGDTLFSIGCGRVCDGTFVQMFEALNKLNTLPNTTQIFPAHEYTEQNIRFSESIDPGNKDLKRYKYIVRTLRQQGQPSLPSILKTEQLCNPFLRCHDPIFLTQLQRLDKNICTPIEAFCYLRQLKDNF